MAARPLVVTPENCRSSTLEILGALARLKLAQPKTGPRGKCERVATVVLPSTVSELLAINTNRRACFGQLAGALAAEAGACTGLLNAVGLLGTGAVSGSFHLPAAVNWLRKSEWVKPNSIALCAWISALS